MHDELMDADLNDLEILKEFTLESKLFNVSAIILSNHDGIGS